MQVKGVDPAALHAMIQKHAKAGKDDSNSSGEVSARGCNVLHLPC
jgi:hypothetical protein